MCGALFLNKNAKTDESSGYFFEISDKRGKCRMRKGPAEWYQRCPLFEIFLQFNFFRRVGKGIDGRRTVLEVKHGHKVVIHCVHAA